VARAVHQRYFIVVPAADVLVVDDEADGCSGGDALEKTGEDLDPVRFPPGGGELPPPGSSAVEVELDVFGCKRDPRRTSVYDDSQCGPVGFSPRGDPKDSSEAVAGHPDSSRDEKTLELCPA